MPSCVMWRKQLDSLILNENGLSTKTSREQIKVEFEISKIYRNLRDHQTMLTDRVHLMKERHLAYLREGIHHLPFHYECLDASRPWLCYWILQSMSLLKYPISQQLTSDIIDFLKRCQDPEGGFAGGPGQLPHLAPTYAAVLSLCILGTEEAYKAIDRPSLQLFLTKMHQPDGSFIMHPDGEVDIRGTYCALVPAVLTNTLTDDMVKNTAEWIASCQTYEGGFSAVPGTEAHGGYAFCSFAALLLLRQHQLCNIQKLLKWASNRQMKLEGGFQGRTNKLVDGCYSFWMGGLFPLLYMALKHCGDKALHPQLWQFHQEALQEYILFCCQSPYGGLVDKPGKGKDFYHTCYCLSGLSVSQHCFDEEKVINITGDSNNELVHTHPLFNIPVTKVKQAMDYFTALPKISLVQFESS